MSQSIIWDEFKALGPTSKIKDLRAFVTQHGLKSKATSKQELHARISRELSGRETAASHMPTHVSTATTTASVSRDNQSQQPKAYIHGTEVLFQSHSVNTPTNTDTNTKPIHCTTSAIISKPNPQLSTHESAVVDEFKALGPGSKIKDLRDFVTRHGLKSKATSKQELHARISRELNIQNVKQSEVAPREKKLVASLAPKTISSRSSPKKFHDNPTSEFDRTKATSKKVLESASNKRETLRGSGRTCSDSSVWKHRNDMDAYTLLTRKYYEENVSTTHIDHVIEIQLLDQAWYDGVYRNDQFGPAYNTRSSKSRALAMSTANHLKNLNMTSSFINYKKRGPFTRWLKKYKRSDMCTFLPSLEEMIHESAKDDPKSEVKGMIYDGTWDRIEGCIVKAYDDLPVVASEKTINTTTIQRTVDYAFAAYIEALHMMLDRMKVF
eukprot:gene9165-1458_t